MFGYNYYLLRISRLFFSWSTLKKKAGSFSKSRVLIFSFISGHISPAARLISCMVSVLDCRPSSRGKFVGWVLVVFVVLPATYKLAVSNTLKYYVLLW